MKRIKGLYQLTFFFLMLSCGEKVDLTSNACGAEDPASEIKWIAEIITQFEAEFEGSQGSSSIELYSYMGQKVFLVSHCITCSDRLIIAYDCEQNEVCKFGGFAGFNTCPDFLEKAIFIETIYEK
jgi:uncharacterized protein DUF6970